MRIPLLTPLLEATSGLAWDCAINLVELYRFGGKSWWRALHVEAARHYLLDPPARVLLREAPKLPLPDGQYVYGETPALALIPILRRVGIGPGDVLADLGCGRGLGVMAAGLEFEVPILGIDAVATLIERARAISASLPFSCQPVWIHGDFLEADWQGASIFYIASTTFHASVMHALTQRLAQHEPDNGRPLRVITLSQPLGPPFRIVARQRYPMTWGPNTVYFHTLDPKRHDDFTPSPDNAETSLPESSVDDPTHPEETT